jgi:hypothetical protein
VRKSIAKWQVQVARPLRPPGQHHRVELAHQLVDGDVGADFHAGPERDALRRHLRHAAVDVMLLHLEVGDAVAQQPADPVVLLVEDHVMASARQLLAAGHA